MPIRHNPTAVAPPFSAYSHAVEVARAKETATQRSWLEERRRLIGMACSRYDGGTFASYSAGLASIEATRKRIAEIEADPRGMRHWGARHSRVPR